MSHFPLHTTDSAPEGARDLLTGARQKLGFVPNLYGHLAEAPAALEAYFDLSALFDKTSFTPAERQVVLLATSVANGCEFCVAAHSMIALKMAGAAAEVVDALRDETSIPDKRLDELAAFTRTVVFQRGWVPEGELDRFLAAGFTKQQAIEVVLGVAMKTLSNYTNHLAGTATNPEFGEFAWSRPKR